MGMLGKVVTGAAVGVLAVAAAPFTGGGSIVAAGVGLGGALAGGGAVAAAAGAGLAGAAAGAALDKAEKKKHMNDVKAAKESAFKDGMNAGKEKSASEIEKFVNFYLATTALSYYAARCDGNISEEEKLEIDMDLDTIRKNCEIPDGVKNKMIEISENENLTWQEVITYLEKVGIDTLKRLRQDVYEIIEASEGVLPQEEKIRQDFDIYLENRMNGDNVFDDGIVNALVII